MSLITMFREELETESATTRRMLQQVPNDNYDWKPHPKSMNIRTLATHIAEMHGWISSVITTDVLDFAVTPYNPVQINNDVELLAHFEFNLESGKSVLIDENNDKLNDNWTLKNGDQIWMSMSKANVIRNTLNHIVHHRAQLGVFLRLLDIPIPGSYGPSADEMPELYDVTK